MTDQQNAALEPCKCPRAFSGRIATFGGSDCWIWMGAKTKRGYGHLSFMSKHVLAHRLMYLLSKGEIPAKMEVCHSCDNPSCVNPDHLWLGTHSENMKDAFKKGRVDVHTPGRKGGDTTKRLFSKVTQ